MRRMTSRLAVMGAAFALLVGCANPELRVAAEDTVAPIAPGSAPVSMTFFGTSSFLVEAGETQLLIDGYFSRAAHYLIGKIGPKPDRILGELYRHRICKPKAARHQGGQHPDCARPDAARLDLILALHGHYDHAMDAPFIAGWAGTRLLTDVSLDPIWDATKAKWPDDGVSFNWQHARRQPYAPHLAPGFAPLPVGPMTVRLYETEHNHNFISDQIKHVTPEDFAFNSRIWDMGLGTSVSALIEHRAGNILIIGSAGEIGDVLRTQNVKAQTVFLSIGGLSRSDKADWDLYWTRAVTDTQAKRVFLIHWDNHQAKLPAPGGQLKPTVVEAHDKVLTHLRGLAKAGDVDLLFAPVGQAFDPFQRTAPKG